MASSFERSTSHLHWLSLSEFHFTEDDYTKMNIISAFLCLYSHNLPAHYLHISSSPYHFTSHLVSISLLSRHQFLFSSVGCVQYLRGCSESNSVVRLPQVFCSASDGFDRQLWNSTLGPGEDRQWHSAGDPPIRSHCLSGLYDERSLALPCHSSPYSRIIIATFIHALFTTLKSKLLHADCIFLSLSSASAPLDSPQY